MAYDCTNSSVRYKSGCALINFMSCRRHELKVMRVCFGGFFLNSGGESRGVHDFPLVLSEGGRFDCEPAGE